MLKKVVCNLVYITKERDESGIPINKEVKKQVLADDIGNWSSAYYQTRERSMQKAVNLSIARDYVNENLEFVEYKGKKYILKDTLIDKNRGDFFVILDLEEMK